MTTLAPAGTTTCSASHSVSQAELDLGADIVNNVDAGSDQGATASDSLSLPVSQSPALTVEKSSTTSSMTATGAVDYSYLITNTGNVTLTGIALVDDNTDAAPVCLVTTLAPAGTTTCSASHSVSQAELDLGADIVNNVDAGSDQGATASDSLSLPVSQSPALTVEKSSTTSSISATGAVDYSYLITNTGNVTLTGIALVDDNTDSAPVCLVTTLAPAETTTCSATHSVTQGELDAGADIVNNVDAGSDQGATASDSLSLPVSQSPALTVEKSSTTSSITATGAVDYSYLITNTGNVTLTGIALVDDNTAAAPVCLVTTLAPAGTTTCSASHSVSQAELDLGADIVNNVDAGSDQGATASDSLSLPVSQSPALTVEKSSTTSSISATGAVDYSYLITNTGNVTLTGIALVDDNTDCGAGLSGDDPGAGGDDDLQCEPQR